MVGAAMERGLLLYSSTGCADGTDGDLIMFGPPFVIDEEQIEEAVSITAEVVGSLP
jgi:adenosylmethionine-8-amino-7-oxononanoate aminotransferase